MMSDSDRFQFEDPRPLLNAFFNPESPTPSFYTGMKSGEVGMDTRVPPKTEVDADNCVLLEEMDAVTLACAMVDARGGLSGAEKVLEEALATVRAEVKASADGGTNEWRAYFAERPSKGPQFFDRLTTNAKKTDGKQPNIYTGMG